jgi:uncharacterized protein YejL (UPF0352 family)
MITDVGTFTVSKPAEKEVFLDKLQKSSKRYGKISTFKSSDKEYKAQSMPQASRYSNEQVEQLLTEMVHVLEKNHTPTDLSLMVLGNMVTNLINTSVAPATRPAIVRSFVEALQASIKEDKAH